MNHAASPVALFNIKRDIPRSPGSGLTLAAHGHRGR